MNAIRPYWWWVNIGSVSGLVPSVSNEISLDNLLLGLIDNKSTLVLVMMWHWAGDKSLPEPILTQICDAILLLLTCWILLNKDDIFVFPIISWHWDGAGCYHPSSWKTRMHLFHTVNNMYGRQSRRDAGNRSRHQQTWCHLLRTLQWRHNERDGISIYRRLYRLVNSWFRRGSKKTSKLRITGLCAGDSPVTGEFPAQLKGQLRRLSHMPHCFKGVRMMFMNRPWAIHVLVMYIHNPFMHCVTSQYVFKQRDVIMLLRAFTIVAA